MGILLTEVAQEAGCTHEMALEFGDAMEQAIRDYVSEIEASGGGELSRHSLVCGVSRRRRRSGRYALANWQNLTARLEHHIAVILSMACHRHDKVSGLHREDTDESLLFSAAMITLVSPAWAQDTMTTATPEALTWKDNPAIPKGGQLAILVGDPTKTGGVVVQRVSFPANYVVPPHTHPYAETVTVISGSVGFGNGEKLDKTGPMAKTCGSRKPGKARSLRLDRKRAGNRPSSVHRSGRHRLHQPGRRSA